MKKIILFSCVAMLSSSIFAATISETKDATGEELENLNAPVSLDVDLPTVAPDKPKVAGDTEVKLEGLFHFQSGFRAQSKLLGQDKNVSANHKKLAFFTEAAVAVTVSRNADEFIYGGKIVLTPTTKPITGAAYNGSHLFVQTDFGKVEAGSPYDAGSKLRISGGDVSAGSGDWSRYAKLEGANMQYSQGTNYAAQTPLLVPYAEYFFDSTFKTELKQLNDETEPPRLISFYTPKYNGLQAGLSFIPDTGNTGGGNHSDDTSPGKGAKTFEVGQFIDADQNKTDHSFILYRSIKNAISGGLSYEYNISDGVDLKLAATGEYGKASGKAKEIQKTPNGDVINYYKVTNLTSYNLGAIVNYGNMSYGASYGSLGKSLTFKEYYKTGRDSRYYNGAVAYTQGPIKASISYFKSQRFKNNVDAVTLGTDFKIHSGIKTYAEVTRFYGSGRPVYVPEAPKKKVRGTVALVGAMVNL